MKIPCKLCITYALCRSKETIECHLINKISTRKNHLDVLAKLYEEFPKAKCFMLDPADFSITLDRMSKEDEDTM